MDWMVIGGLAALIVRLANAGHLSGMLRAKNASSSLIRAMAEVCAGALSFWALGAAFALARGNPLIGFRANLLCAVTTPAQAGQIFLLLATILLTSSIVSGAMAERSRFFSQILVSAILCAIVVPIAAYWVWNNNGWLSQTGPLGFLDVAGAGVIHLTGAVVALIGVMVLGPRIGKHNRDGSSNAIPGHSVPMAAAGAALMLVAWIPYVCAFDPLHGGLTALNVLMATVTGGFVSLLASYWRFRKPDVFLTLAGFLAAAVAISASGGYVGTRSAVVIGALSGLIVPWLTLHLDVNLKIDDPIGAIAIHGGGGLLGLLSAGFFSHTASLGARLHAAANQFLGALAIIALAAVAGLTIFSLLRALHLLRVNESDEVDGLDLAEHDLGAYPDFQQNMIKSYHLREM